MDSASLVEPLSAHPHLSALASLVRASALDATLARRADYASRQRIGTGPATGPGHIPEGLTPEDAQTAFGNVLSVLERGASTPEERALLGALMALSLRLAPPSDAQAAAEVGTHLVWLAAHTPCDALSALDVALAEGAVELWDGVASVLLDPDSLPADFGATEALVAAAALRRSISPEAQQLRFQAAEVVTDRALLALLAPNAEELGGELWGEMQPAPRGPLLTLILAATLLLFLIQLGRLIARYAFAYKRPAALRLGPQGLELAQRIELMGRVLRDRSTVVPLSNLARVTREVKYARSGLYVGLIALTLGTYFGTGYFVDGVRQPGGSGELLGLGALFIVVGLLVDFMLSSGAEALRGGCRLVVVPRRGRTLCVGGLDPVRADALLAALVERTREPEPVPATSKPDAPEPATA
jgi:hypothetical protein